MISNNSYIQSRKLALYSGLACWMIVSLLSFLWGLELNSIWLGLVSGVIVGITIFFISQSFTQLTIEKTNLGYLQNETPKIGSNLLLVTELEQLKKSELYRREFIGNVSHELKTPIFNIQGYIHTLLDGGLEDPEINTNYLKRADKNVDRMITIVDDLETITQLESGVITLDVKRFDIVDLIKDTIESVEKKANDREIKIKLDKFQEKAIKVLADKDRISQVLINLITNSIKYGKRGGKTEILIFEKEEKIWIEISDNGIGISEKHLPRLFERFYRIDKSRSREGGGSGLGLSIVKHIIEAHSQQITVKSKEGEGSTFSFSLPKYQKM